MRSLSLTVALSATLFAGVLAGQANHQKWVDEDVVYIITDAERLAFQQIDSDEGREQFIERFWARHNPAPGQGQNPFKEEHYPGSHTRTNTSPRAFLDGKLIAGAST